MINMKRSFKNFWLKEAYKIKWFRKPTKVLDRYDNKLVWFNDGKIMTLIIEV